VNTEPKRGVENASGMFGAYLGGKVIREVQGAGVDKELRGRTRSLKAQHPNVKMARKRVHPAKNIPNA